MKIEVTLDLLEEMAICIVDNCLNRDEAADYIRACALDPDDKETTVV